MKYLPLILIILLGSCSHYRYIAKHKAEICATCPTEQTTETTQTDTTYYGEVPADTIRIYGLDTVYNTVIVDNPVYKIIKEKGEVKVIIKEKRIPFTVTKYRDNQSKTKVIERVVRVIPWWIYFVICGAFAVGFYLRKFLFK